MAETMYLKFEEPSIAGSSTAAGHEGEIEVLSWSQGTGTVGEVSHQTFTFTKYLDSATNELLRYSFSEKQLAKATLTCYRSDGNNKPVEYLRVVMEHVFVQTYTVSGGPGDIPVENVVLHYGVIQYTYAKT